MGYLISVKGRLGLKVFVQPKAKKTRVVGLHDGRVKIAIAAPPVDGKANKEVASFLAELFALKKNEVGIVSGQRSRKKVCILGELDEPLVRRKLAPLLQEMESGN